MKEPNKNESFEAWLIRCFYWDGLLWLDTSVFPIKTYNEGQLRVCYNEFSKDLTLKK